MFFAGQCLSEGLGWLELMKSLSQQGVFDE